MTEKEDTSPLTPIAQCIFNYKQEAEYARQNRITLNRQNFDCFNLRQDYSYKKVGQSMEFLPKQAGATQQLASFLQQGLMDLGTWFRIQEQAGVKKEDMAVQPEEMQKLLSEQLDLNTFPNKFNDALILGIVGSLMIFKVGGKYVAKPEFVVRDANSDLGSRDKTLVRKDKQVWQLDISLLRQEDYFPDPTGLKLYEGERITIDHHVLIQIAKDNPDIFDLAAVERMQPGDDDLQTMDKARETGQNITLSQYRRKVTFYEFWGTFLDPLGKVMHENSVAACDMQGNVIRPPKKNPFWHGKSPYVTCPVTRVPHSVWHKALADAGTRSNFALNELYNLMVDGGMMAVHGIKQLHSNWLEDPTQVADGVPPGQTLLVNNQCPPGAKALERVDTSAVPADGFNMYQLIDREFQQSMLTNDSRMGSNSQGNVKATEIVAGNQALTGILNGIVKVIEGEGLVPLLTRSWEVMAQHMNDLDSKKVASLLGEDRARAIAALSKEELFAGTVEKAVFKVFGLSMTLNKIQDFRKIQALLQSVGMSPEMMAEFKRKYSMTKLLGEIVKSLDIDEEKITVDEQELMQRQYEQKAAIENAAQLAAVDAQAKEGGPQPGANAQSQIPQMAGNSTQDGGISVQRGLNNMGMTSPA